MTNRMTDIDFQRIRDSIIRDTFGGPNTYLLLKERNPQIDMLLNAGIYAGLREAERAEQAARALLSAL